MLLLLAGCALFPLDESECKGVDWVKRGYADGFGGNQQQYLRLERECRRRFGVAVPEAEYFRGYRDGYDEWYRIRGSIERRR